MVQFEEFRHALGQVVGEQDLETPLPIRILVFKSSKGWTSPAPLVEGRDRYAIVLEEKQPVSPEIYIQLTRLFLASSTTRMPPAFEHGLIEFFSTFAVKGIHIIVGTPPPNPDLDWARIHLLVTDPDYFGKIRVLLYNLRKGVDEEAAYLNAFGKKPAVVEAQVKQHFASHDFQPGPSPPAHWPSGISRTQSPMATSGWPARTCWRERQSAAEYKGLIRDNDRSAEAEEGSGLIRSPRATAHAEARAPFRRRHARRRATSARCYIEYAKLETDNAKATKALLQSRRNQFQAR